MMSFSKCYYKREIQKICKHDIVKRKFGHIEGRIVEIKFINLIDTIMTDNERITWDEFFNRCGLN